MAASGGRAGAVRDGMLEPGGLDAATAASASACTTPQAAALERARGACRALVVRLTFMPGRRMVEVCMRRSMPGMAPTEWAKLGRLLAGERGGDPDGLREPL